MIPLTTTFALSFDEIQPSQLYISEAKLDAVLKVFEFGQQSQLEPVPVKELDGELVSTDGHTRGVAWLKNGYDEIDVCWEDSDLDWDAYRICVQWCKDEKITNMRDLCDRVIPHDEYLVLWLERCRVMQEHL